MKTQKINRRVRVYPDAKDSATAKQIKSWRWRNNLTQPDAASYLRIPLGTFQKWEHSVQKPSALAARMLDGIINPQAPMRRAA